MRERAAAMRHATQRPARESVPDGCAQREGIHAAVQHREHASMCRHERAHGRCTEELREPHRPHDSLKGAAIAAPFFLCGGYTTELQVRRFHGYTKSLGHSRKDPYGLGT